MRLRDALPRDLDALVELERACFEPRQAFSRDEYRYMLTRAKSVNVVAQEGAQIVGYVGAFRHAAQRAGHVFTLNVRPEARRKGTGRALLEACHSRLRAAGMHRVALEVNVGNAPAIALYESAGYQRLERLVGYYPPGQYADDDAWLYARDL